MNLSSRLIFYLEKTMAMKLFRQVSSISQDGESEEDVKVLEKALSRRMSKRNVKAKNGKKKDKQVSCYFPGEDETFFSKV